MQVRVTLSDEGTSDCAVPGHSVSETHVTAAGVAPDLWWVSPVVLIELTDMSSLPCSMLLSAFSTSTLILLGSGTLTSSALSTSKSEYFSVANNCVPTLFCCLSRVLLLSNVD